MIRSAFPMAIVVPARSGQEQEPLFLEDVGGCAVIDHTFEDAESVAENGDVTLILSTDDTRIADHAAKRQASWMTRLREDDEVKGGYFVALSRAVSWADEQLGKSFSSVLILEPSHPFRPAGLIANALDIFERSDETDTIVAVVKEYGNLWSTDTHGGLTRIMTPEGSNFFREVAGLCLLTRPQSMNRMTAMGTNVGFVVVEEEWALIDIHGVTGVRMAERFLEFISSEHDAE